MQARSFQIILEITRERDCHTVELSKREPKEFIMLKAFLGAGKPTGLPITMSMFRYFPKEHSFTIV